MKKNINNEFIKYRRVIASLLSKIRPNASTQDIEDILQDTYVNTFNASLKQKIRFPKAFMVTTAIRLANRQVNSTQRLNFNERIEDFSDESLSSLASDGLSSRIEKEVMYREDFGILCEAVNLLPAQCRRVFILKKIYGWSQREIARHLQISESTVEKHVAKGLLKTRKKYLSLKAETANAKDNDKVVSVRAKRAERGKR